MGRRPTRSHVQIGQGLAETVPETDENNYLQVELYNNTFPWMPGQSWCKPSVSKNSRVHLSSPFLVCASVDLVHQNSATIIVY